MTTKFVVHVSSESCDHWHVKITEDVWPEDEAEQLALLIRSYPMLDDGHQNDGDGPGIAGSWLYIEAVTEV